jgi:hypothetical protein
MQVEEKISTIDCVTTTQIIWVAVISNDLTITKEETIIITIIIIKDGRDVKRIISRVERPLV